ncbi:MULTISPECIES: GNAT family N-acetyltransferase [unclassified Cryobacterium]|uniref:GNAT family N-acetyltransferase n=1 Tax=unclassified Cryobacterium TaxID=2649013 RepID=UPI00106CBFF3|nr:MULTISPECIES: GNAT family N-acetyltransferase [unclassified Cryobacterium]TFD03647.1 N-acetyltransferase [Cryobacterium sp. TMT1-66-1]TFD12952.1 N-acetyltransferase [Cryobacterium sp. TMT1-2-2]TFD50408.1 N-acetyltransferase [Cryobacterium sp. Hh11]
MDWPTTEPIASVRLLLEPLSVEHAPSMIEVLADPALYEYTGGEIPSLTVLEKRYAAQAVGHSDDGSQWWLNWVVTQLDSGKPVGFVQATVEDDGSSLVADIAWVISPDWQGQGIASEAAQAMIAWLRSNEVCRLTAHIHPDHQASMKVAQNQALHATSSKKDGETRWESQQP